MKSIRDKIQARIEENGEGWVFTPRHFLDLGPRKSVDMALARLRQAGRIRRLARGLYDYPRIHAKLGTLSPSPDAVARAIGESDVIRLQPSGAYAMNLLGLSPQVPARIVYLTDGAERTVKIGRQQIRLKRTTPRNMATAGAISGLVIQALRYLGRNGVDRAHLNHLRRTLSARDREQLWQLRVHAPAWMHPLFAQIRATEDGG